MKTNVSALVMALFNAIGGNSNSTKRWNDVPRGTMDEASSHVRLNLPTRQGRGKDCSASSSKRTSQITAAMSANDPKQTSVGPLNSL
jgi:hypothetical protein